MRNQTLIDVGLFVLGLWVAWQVAGKIVADDERSLLFGVLIFAGCMVAAKTLQNWRTGFYLFFVCMLFEDLFRKYGIWFVAIGRLFMGIRGAMVFTAGTSRFKFAKFILADGLAAVFSGGIFMCLGYWGGTYGGDIAQRVREFRYSMWIGAGVLAIVLAIFFFRRDRKRSHANTLPQIETH